MVFSSLIFLYGFFPLSLLAYGLCRTQKAQNIVLLISSLIFYAWGAPKYLFLLMLMALSSWGCALEVEAARSPRIRKAWLTAAAVVDLGLIGYFKYAGFLCSLFGPVPEVISNIVLPIGISFYTFQLLTYVIDVYRGQAKAQKRYWNVLLYAALFHQCIAGPIVRYKSIDRELFSGVPRDPQWNVGISRFASGLAKKVLLANPCGALAGSLIVEDTAIAAPSFFAQNLAQLQSVSVLGAWLGAIAYALHIYLDFSAYSDMAIGMGQMLGLHYPENFNYPYISRSVTEFWRRWHMSLSTFFRDYVYIPLGGSRCSRPRMIFNTLLVWTLTGIWHGASWNFIFWGLWYFAFLMLERFLLKPVLEKMPVLSHLYLLVVVLLGWVIFRFSDARLALALMGSMFGSFGNALWDFTVTSQFQSNVYLLLASLLCCTPLAKHLGRRVTLLAERAGLIGVWNICFYCVIPILLLLLSTACLVGNSYNPFIYFQF